MRALPARDFDRRVERAQRLIVIAAVEEHQALPAQGMHFRQIETDSGLFRRFQSLIKQGEDLFGVSGAGSDFCEQGSEIHP